MSPPRNSPDAERDVSPNAGSWAPHVPTVIRRGQWPTTVQKTTNTADQIRSAALLGPRRSGGTDVLGFVALAALTDVELDLLALVERLVALTCDVGVVDEYVLPALA